MQNSTFTFRGSFFAHFASLYILITGMVFIVARRGSFLSVMPAFGVLLIFLLGFWLVWQLIFSAKVELTPEGITKKTLWGGKWQMSWEQVKDIRYKPEGYNKGVRYPAHLILLDADGRRLTLNDNYSPEHCFTRVEGYLHEDIDVEQIKEEAIKKGWLAAPSWEDLPELVLALCLLISAYPILLRVMITVTQ